MARRARRRLLTDRTAAALCALAPAPPSTWRWWLRAGDGRGETVVESARARRRRRRLLITRTASA
ncbi:MAG: hypothetical protein ACOCYN_02045 [Planctomycetota bacterium]